MTFAMQVNGKSTVLRFGAGQQPIFIFAICSLRQRCKRKPLASIFSPHQRNDIQPILLQYLKESKERFSCNPDTLLNLGRDLYWTVDVYLLIKIGQLVLCMHTGIIRLKLSYESPEVVSLDALSKRA